MSISMSALKRVKTEWHDNNKIQKACTELFTSLLDEKAYENILNEKNLFQRLCILLNDMCSSVHPKNGKI